MLAEQTITMWDDTEGDHPLYTYLDWVEAY